MKMNKSILITSIIGITLFLVHCKKEIDPISLPQVETGYFDKDEGVIIGEVLDLGPGVKEYGHLWHTLPTPTITQHNKKTENDTIAELGPIYSEIDSTFTITETQYYRAYVIDIYNNIYYGQIKDYSPDYEPPKACFTYTLIDELCTADCDVKFENCTTEADKYYWEFGDGNTSTSANPPYTYASFGNYAVTLRITRGNYTDDTTMLVSINIADEEVIADFTIVNNNCTAPCEVAFLNNSQNASAYHWEFGDGNSSVETNPIYQYDSDSTYTVTLTATSIADTSIISKPVQVIEESMIVPTAHIRAERTECVIGQSCMISFSADSSQNAVTYKWDMDNNGFYEDQYDNQINITHTFTEVGTDTVRLQVESIDNIEHDAIKIIQINPSESIVPLACFTSDTLCQIGNCSMSFNAYCSVNEVIYRWNFDDGSLPMTTNEPITAHEFTEIGTYRVTLEVESTDGEKHDTMQVIEVIQAEPIIPVACFTADTLCQVGNCSISFNAYCSENEVIYDWDFDDGSLGTTTTAPIINHEFMEAGTYEVTLEVESIDGETRSTTQTVQVNEAEPIIPVACFTADTLCQVGNCLMSFNAYCSQNGIIYTWDFNDGSPGTTTTEPIIEHEFMEAGTYEVILEVESIDGETHSIMQVVQVNAAEPIIPLACFEYGPSECHVDDCHVDFYPYCSENAVIYKWDFDDGSTNVINDGEPVSHIFTAVGTYEVKLKVTSEDGNLDSTMQVVQVNEVEPIIPIACFVPSNTECAVNDCLLTFDGDCSSDDVIEYKWYIDDSPIDAGTIDFFSHEFTSPGTYQVKLKVKNDAGFEAETMETTIEVYDLNASFNTQGDDFSEGCTIEFVNTSQNVTTYMWDFGDGNTSTEEHPFYAYENPGLYNVVLTVTFNSIQQQYSNTVQISPIIKFEDWFPSEAGARDIAITSEGGYIHVSSNFGNGVFAYKMDAYGNPVWPFNVIYGADDDISEIRSIKLLADGNYILAGYTKSPSLGATNNDSDVYVIKINSDGNVIWESTYGGSGDDEGYEVVEASDGGYVIAGFTDSDNPPENLISSPEGGTDGYIIKVNANGGVVWQNTFGGSGDDEFRSITSTTNGGYAMVGVTSSSEFVSSGVTDAFFAKAWDSGGRNWDNSLHFGGANSIIQIQSGEYIIVGYTTNSNNTPDGAFFYKTIPDSSNPAETSVFNGIGNETQIYDVAMTEDGGFILAGYTQSNGYDGYLIKTNSDGDFQWDKTLGGGGDDRFFSINSTQDCGYIISGFENSNNQQRSYILKTNGRGNSN